MSSINEKMTALADAVRSKANRSDTLTIDAMTEAVNGLVVNGVDVDERTLTVTPTVVQQTFSSSDLGANTYYSTVTVNAIPAEYITTTDATAVSSDILYEKTAYINGRKVTGNMTNYGDVQKQFSNTSDTLSINANGYFKTIKVNLTRKTLEVTPTKSAQTLRASSEGSDVFYTQVDVAPIPAEYITTADATATEGAILEGETAYVNGQKITGKYMAPSPENVRAGISFGYEDIFPDYDFGKVPQVGTFTSDATAEATDILPGKTAYVKGEEVTGAMSVKSAETYTPGTEDITIKSGVYLSEDQTIKGDANLKAENIAEGVTLFGVEGSFTGGSDTSDATVTAADLLEGVTAYGAEGKVTGTISTVTPSLEGNVFTVPSGFIAEPQTLTAGTVKLAETYTPGTADISIPANLFLAEAQTIKGDANLKAENIAKGVSIFNVEGSFTSDATAVSSDILEGRTAYVKGEKLTGTIGASTPYVTGNEVTVPQGYIAEEKTLTVGTAKTAETFIPGTSDITIPADTYLAGALTIKGDSALTAENIKAGVSIFNVSGSFTSDATAAAEDIASGKTAYVKGEKVTGTASGNSVVPHWYYDSWEIKTRVPPCSSFSVPARERSTTFKVLNGELWRFYGTSISKKASGSANWTYVYNIDSDNALAIGSGMLYKVTADVFTRLISPEIADVTQVAHLGWGHIFCTSNGELYAGNDDPKIKRVEYLRARAEDPIQYVTVSKILNCSQYYENFWIITADGSLASCWLDKDSFDNGDGAAFAEIDPQSVADGNPFVNYYPQGGMYDYGDGSSTYELAFRTDGLWYRQSGTYYDQTTGKTQRYAWRRAYNYGWRAKDWLGYCSMYGVGEYKGWDEEKGEDIFEYRLETRCIALNIDTSGRLWKIAPEGEIISTDFEYVNFKLTGLSITQVGTDTDWQCVPPKIERGQGQQGRPNNTFGQKGGKVINMWYTSENELGWEEYPMPPMGKMICTSGSDMYFAPEGVTVDLSKAGGTF